jgi:hypothetical protein
VKKKKRATLLVLGPEDQADLETLAARYESPRSVVLRWALRWFFATGAGPVPRAARKAIGKAMGKGKKKNPDEKGN